MVLIEIAAAVAVVVIACVVWIAWHKHHVVIPPWGMSEFHRRMRSEPPRSPEKLDRKTTD